MKLKIAFLIAAFAGIITSCKDQLDVHNPNEPTTGTLLTEDGIVKFALAGIYVNGFKDLKIGDGVAGPAFYGYTSSHDLMADVIGAEAANVFINQIGCPEKVTLDNGTVVANPNAPIHQPAMLRQNNLNTLGNQNPAFYEWGYMYALNHSANYLLSVVDGIQFTGDAATKIAVLKAWAYWWKGFAYSRIGSIYYAGVIVDDVLKTNGNYKSSANILAEAENNFKKCEDILGGLAANADYVGTVGSIIPLICQVGHGGVITPSMWLHNINSMRARNILANTTIAAMTSAQWNQIMTLTGNGISATDFVFTLRSNENGDLMNSTGGCTSSKATGDPKAGTTYKISERLIQDFQPGDARLDNNFLQLSSAWLGNQDRGNVFNTRWQLLDGGNGAPGVIVYGGIQPGAYELFMAGSYEENELMKAEANIYLGNIDAGLTSVDNVRTYEGAGLAATSGTGLNQAQAIAQLRSERRVGLLFRSVSFYDARRYGVINPLSAGGGRTNAVVIDNTGTINTNASIDYQFWDYWDVPDNEIVYNPPAEGSAPTQNPKN